MSQSGSFGVNFRRTYDATIVPTLPAKLLDHGSSPEGDFVFVQASAAIAQYAFVVITKDGKAAELTTTNATSNNLQIGVAQVSAAANEYLWVWTGGLGGGGVGRGIRGKIAASYVADANLNTTATAGVADDAATTRIQNVVAVAATVAAGNVELRSTGYLKVN